MIFFGCLEDKLDIFSDLSEEYTSMIIRWLLFQENVKVMQSKKFVSNFVWFEALGPS